MMTDNSVEIKDRINSKLATTMTLTGRLRWLHSGARKKSGVPVDGAILQQEWRNVFTGATEWRDIEIVVQDKAE